MSETITIQDRIVEEAYSWLGTPYHQGCCIKGINGGISCGDLPVDIFKVMGFIPKSFKLPYIYKDWHRGLKKNVPEDLFRNIILKFGYEISFKERCRGDVITFKYNNIESHIAIIVEDDCIIHAVSGKGVKKQRLRNYKNICSVYRVKDVRSS